MDNEEKTPLNANADENDRLLLRFQNGDCRRRTSFAKGTPDSSKARRAASSGAAPISRISCR